MATSHAPRRQKLLLLVLLLVSAVADAHDSSSHPLLPPQRSLYLSKSAKVEVPEVFVAGGMVTTLRLPVTCDSSRTQLLGWEGRFEPLLAGGRSVVLVPLQNLALGDRFMLRVTLMDGTELPFTVTASDERVDGQVNVFPDPTSPEAIEQALEERTQENELLLAENQRHQREESSVDHALAALLLNDQVAMTPFGESDKWLLREQDVEVEVRVFTSKRKISPKKAAVVFQVKNQDAKKPWRLQEARLSTFTSRESRPFALRAAPSSIPPGMTGRIAIVTDFDAFDQGTDGGKLVLELFREGGRLQVCVVLAPQDHR